MKPLLLLPLAAILLVANSANAQDRIYRCGNEYTNNVAEAQSRNCKLIEGGNVTVVQGPRVPAPAAVKLASATQTGQRVDAGEQRARDSDARTILESELKKAQARQAEMLREYNNGEPKSVATKAATTRNTSTAWLNSNRGLREMTATSPASSASLIARPHQDPRRRAAPILLQNRKLEQINFRVRALPVL